MGFAKGLCRLLRSRRAMTLGVLLTIVITLAGGFVVGATGYQIAKYLKEEDPARRCSMSLFATAEMMKIKQKTAGLVDFASGLDCAAKDVEITVRDVTVTGKSTGRIDETKIAKVYADEMKACWDMVGKGGFFNAAFDDAGFFDEAACLICAKISFSPDLRKKLKTEFGNDVYPIPSLKYFLATRRIPEASMTYFEYFYKLRPSAEDLKLWRDEISLRPIDGKMYIVWRVAQDGVPIGTVYVTQGVFLWSSSQISGTLKVEDEEVPTCSFLLNG